MIRGRYLSSKDNTSDALALRLVIPEFTAERDSFDQMAIYAVVYDDDDSPCGTGRIYIDDDSHFRMDYLGVLPEKRGRYIGDLVARMLLFRAMDLNANGICVSVPKSCVRFFARYGFKPTRESESIYEMFVSREDLRLEGSCSKGKNGTCGGNCETCKQ